MTRVWRRRREHDSHARAAVMLDLHGGPQACGEVADERETKRCCRRDVDVGNPAPSSSTVNVIPLAVPCRLTFTVPGWPPTKACVQRVG